MFALLLFVVLPVVAFGTVSAVIGRGKYRWVALASGAFALVMLVSVAVLLLGAGTVAIGANGSVAQVLVMAFLLSTVIACFLCVISGIIAIRKRG
jgi:hypothetical protein